MRFYNQGEAHQRFSLRKLTVGVASVLLGTTFMVFGSQSVQADEVSDSNIEQIQSQNESAQKSQDVDNKVEKNTEVASDKNDVESSSTNKAVESKNVAVDTNDNKDASTSDPSDAPVTRDDVIELFGLDKSDISAEDLAKLGLKSDEYYYKGVKYHVKGTAEITDLNNGEVYNFDNIKVLHNADGTFRNSNADVDDDLQIIKNLTSVMHYSLLPVLEADKVIYTNKGTQLGSDDIKRAIDEDNPEIDIKNAVEFKWDLSDPDHIVDVNKAGTYDGLADIYYELGQGDGQATKMPVSVGVKVTVVDLHGKDIYVHINGEVPSAEESVTGFPTGSTDITWVNKPNTSTTGDSTGRVSVTYPDGTKGMTDVTVHVVAPQVPPTITIDKGSNIPDATTVVENAKEITDHIPDTDFNWKPGVVIDTNTPGETVTEIITTWPDGTTTTSPIKVIVKDKDVTPGDVIVAETTLNRKVEFVDTNDHSHQLADPVINSVKFELHKITDENGNVTYKWTPAEGTYPSVPAKQIPGWIVDDQSRNGVPAAIVTPDFLPEVTSDADISQIRKQGYTFTELLTYHQDGGTPVDPGNPTDPTNPDTPVTPKNPDTPTTPDDKPNTDENVTPHPTTPEKHKPSTTKKTKHNNGPIGPSEKTGDRNSGLGSSNDQALAAANKTAKKATLPKTGSKQNGVLAVVGAAVAAIGGLFGLASRKKRF